MREAKPQVLRFEKYEPNWQKGEGMVPYFFDSEFINDEPRLILGALAPR